VADHEISKREAGGTLNSGSGGGFKWRGAAPSPPPAFCVQNLPSNITKTEDFRPTIREFFAIF
jgi:hypothetical protein